ncbi:Fe/S biogenesis protein nfuA [Acholeplasma oculi]|uniref:Nitrogen-fixing protein NifU n=1 Tax=Acholeplasma oculi TaxID=35623 RepID=A0A061A9M8_9MOLU|nr:NifU family protein [Acholeplasma oculi]CDR30104.1 nitrogen-fixing protein NifU [Acholeplasma oculi]SKC44792.1 Fe-S cluster biogenesis protein NfuA, 4Fe-4S-binding domain [Acholeplasma oculi]SUT88395.1 Fe/S biogenesis protein nfuA [Acholeplasma oculi]
MSIENMKEQVNQIIKRVRPYIQRDGGDIELVDIEDGIVYVKMGGACDGCAAIDITLKQGIETMLLENVPGVIAVVTT